MPRLMFACFLLGGLIPEPTPTDYCDTSFCATGLTNVGCNPPPLTGGPACDDKDPVVKEIGQAEIDYLLDLLNTLRSEYASGQHGPIFPTASRMPILQWNAELAKQAGNNARSCTIGRDQCHNTAEFSNSGQGFASGYGHVLPETKQSLNSLVTQISREKLAYQMSRSFYASFSYSRDAGHLANVLNDRSSKVGCALQKWYSDVYDSYTYIENGDMSYLVCNFSDDLVDGEPLYTQGATGSGCSSVSTTYSGLCAA